MATARLVYEFWEEGKLAIVAHLKIPEKQAHRKYIESIAGSVKASVSAMYTHSRIGRNVIAPGLHSKHDIFSYGQWESLLRNIKKEKGLCDIDVLSERIEWMYSEADKHFGEFPSTRDINNYYKKNGDKQEWELLWANIVRNARKLVEINVAEYPLAFSVCVFRILKAEGEREDTEEMEAEVKHDKAGEG